MTQYTPTPWVTFESNNSKLIHIEADPEGQGTGNGHNICTMTGNREQARANAAFIVRACNAHDALVSAVKCSQAVETLNGCYPAEMREYAFSVLISYGWEREGVTTYQAFVDGLQREALKLARGEV